MKWSNPPLAWSLLLTVMALSLTPKATSAQGSSLVGADALVMLTDVEGLCAGDTKKCIDTVTVIDSGIEKFATGTDKEYSLGGMKTKLEACKIAMSSGVCCVIANGRKKDILLNVMNGETTGTFFVPKKDKMQARKRWIAYNAKTQGRIIIDQGAKEALLKKNSSLLPCGIKAVEGKFDYGDVVFIATEKGHEFAKGLSNYNSADLAGIKGMSTKEAEEKIKKGFYQEVVHRDNLVIL